MDLDDDWTFKQIAAAQSEEQWIFRKNIAAGKLAAAGRLNYVAYLTINYTPTDNRGLPSIRDEAVFEEIEDQFDRESKRGADFIHVGSVLKSGVKDLMFYIAKEGALQNVIAQINKKYPLLAASLEVVSDPGWEHYKDFP